MVESNHDEERRARIENIFETLQSERLLVLKHRDVHRAGFAMPLPIVVSQWKRLTPPSVPLRRATRHKTTRFSCTCV